MHRYAICLYCNLSRPMAQRIEVCKLVMNAQKSCTGDIYERVSHVSDEIARLKFVNAEIVNRKQQNRNRRMSSTQSPELPGLGTHSSFLRYQCSTGHGPDFEPNPESSTNLLFIRQYSSAGSYILINPRGAKVARLLPLPDSTAMSPAGLPPLPAGTAKSLASADFACQASVYQLLRTGIRGLARARLKRLRQRRFTRIFAAELWPGVDKVCLWCNVTAGVCAV